MQNYFLIVDGTLKMTGTCAEVEAARTALPIDSKFDVIFGRILPKTEARAAKVKYPVHRPNQTAAKKTKANRKIVKKKATVAHNHVAQ